MGLVVGSLSDMKFAKARDGSGVLLCDVIQTVGSAINSAEFL